MTFDPDFRARLRRFLPDDILDQLPDAQALTAAIRRLNSLHQAVSSFLPQYIADNEQLYSEDYSALRPGTFMFADVSGFTALSEMLQRVGGREGAEILTQIINSFFARMLEILAKSNGQLLKFAGDALLTFFPAMPGDDEAPLAIRTGLRMQRAMQEDFQPIQHPLLAELVGEHRMELTMSIGICQGKLFEAVVGNLRQRDHIIQGDLPGQAMAAEEAGERDDVIITPALQAAHADLFETEPVGDGFFKVLDNFGDDLDDYEFVVPRRRRAQTTALFDFLEQNLLEDLQRGYERVEGVSRFVATEIVNKLAFRGDHIESENRPATVIFNHFTGFADLLDRWGEEQLPLLTSMLNRYYTIMQRTIDSNGGSLTRTDPYKRGVKMLITFGAPVAHLDDPERAVTTALEMNRQLADFNARLRDELDDAPETLITQRIGITHGPVFAGEVGWRARREYTVMGDDVNLAARLMSKGQMADIMVSQRVWDRVNPHFDTEALEPLVLKGKAEPVPAYYVTARTPSIHVMSATSDTPFVGRDLQMLSLTYGLQQAKGPRRRQAFALQGEAGVGKTRMARQVASDAVDSGFLVVWANCQLGHAQDQSVWAALVAQLLQLDRARSVQARRRLLHVRLDELEIPELEAVLAPLVFGTGQFQAHESPRAMTPPIPTPQPAQSEPSTPDKPATNIFSLAEVKTDLAQSGIFGAVRRHLETEEPSSTRDTTELFRVVQRKTSVSACIVRFLEVLSERVPLLLVIDDVHRADPNTMTILRQVISEVTRARLVLVITYEPGDDLELGIRRAVRVSDLDEEETALLAARALGVPEIGPRLRALLWERTSGRPLFIESLLRLLGDDGHLVVERGRAELVDDVAPETLPDNVRELILSRLDRLSPQAREVLRTAAILGDGFSQAALVVVGDFENEERLETLLDELVQAGIIERLPDAVYRFQHGLTETVVYESLNRLQRQKMHRAAAEYWEQQPESDRNVLVEAHHWVRGGNPMRGIELVFAAADEAENQGQIERAIELFVHAREIFPHDESVRANLERLQTL